VTTVLLPRLRQIRKRAHLTQSQLGEMASLSAESICLFEKLQRAASLNAAERLARVLGVSLKRLIERAPPQRPRQPATERVCTECRATKPISDFTPIRATRTGHYGRCRTCRAARAKQRYWADPLEREKQKARTARNKQRRVVTPTVESRYDSAAR
jgi:transcriptional regulator with XRE-family HTH domain